MTGQPSPGSAAAKKTVACDCLGHPSTLCSSRNRRWRHSHSFLNKRAAFLSIDNHHAAAGSECQSIELRFLKDPSFHQIVLLSNSAIVPRELFCSQPIPVSTSMNGFHNVSLAFPPHNATSGQSFASPNRSYKKEEFRAGCGQVRTREETAKAKQCRGHMSSVVATSSVVAK